MRKCELICRCAKLIGYDTFPQCSGHKGATVSVCAAQPYVLICYMLSLKCEWSADVCAVQAAAAAQL